MGEGLRRAATAARATDPNNAEHTLCGWWIQVARHGMSTTEAVRTLVEYLDEHGFKIVRKRNKT